MFGDGFFLSVLACQLLAASSTIPIPIKVANIAPGSISQSADVQIEGEINNVSSKWTLYGENQIGFDFKLSLGSSWSLDPNDYSALRIIINGGNLTSDPLMIAFSQSGSNEYFAINIGHISYSAYPGSCTPENATSCSVEAGKIAQNFTFGDIEDILNEETGENRWKKVSEGLDGDLTSNNCNVDATVKQHFVLNQPIAIILQNYPMAHSFVFHINTGEFGGSASGYYRTCWFDAITSDSTMDILIATIRNGSSYDISSIDLELYANYTFAPTHNPTDSPTFGPALSSTQPTPDPTLAPTPNPTANSTLHPTMEPSSALIRYVTLSFCHSVIR